MGQIVAIFYGTPNREIVNSVELLLLDPKYEDGKAVLIDIKGIVDVNSNTNTWANGSHTLTFTKLWKEREGEARTCASTQRRSQRSIRSSCLKTWTAKTMRK